MRCTCMCDVVMAGAEAGAGVPAGTSSTEKLCTAAVLCEEMCFAGVLLHVWHLQSAMSHAGVCVGGDKVHW
jgi:hypothetical protein